MAEGKAGPKADRSNRLKARLPRGLADRGAAEIRRNERMLAAIREVYELYGFEPVETPAIEYTDALGKFLPDEDRPNEGVFSFQDDDEAWLSLRYDLTAPLARHFAENFERLPKPYRTYRAGWVFRNEKPGPGRFRQFMQFDADIVGAPYVAADAEMCMMMADTLERLGLERGQYVVRVNNRKILDGVMEAIGLGGEENAGKRLQVLRAIDKLDRLGTAGVRQLLGEGRKDESGDFTRGAGLDENSIETVLNYFSGLSLTEPGSAAEASRDPENVPTFQSPTGGQWHARKTFRSALDTFNQLSGRLGASNAMLEAGICELEEIATIIHSAGYDDGRVEIDSSVVRGLEYYTGPVYEAELLFETVNERGEPARFGSIGGGGRYDGLVARFRGEAVPATGFSIGVSRLQAALFALGKLGADEEAAGPVVVLVMERERIADYQKMAADLRAEGVRAETYLGASGMKAQMKYADRRDAPCVVIQGSDERERGEVQVKDLVEGARAAAGIEDNATWREARPAQVTVARADLVATVKAIVARHREGARAGADV